jgi:hypothetical protein
VRRLEWLRQAFFRQISSSVPRSPVSLPDVSDRPGSSRIERIPVAWRAAQASLWFVRGRITSRLPNEGVVVQRATPTSLSSLSAGGQAPPREVGNTGHRYAL